MEQLHWNENNANISTCLTMKYKQETIYPKLKISHFESISLERYDISKRTYSESKSHVFFLIFLLFPFLKKQQKDKHQKTSISPYKNATNNNNIT